MFDFDRIQWDAIPDKLLRVLMWLQRGLTVFVMVYAIGAGLHRGLLSETLSGFFAWLVGGLVAAVAIGVLFFLMDIGRYVMDKFSDWLTFQLGRYPKARRWIIIPFAAVLLAFGPIIVFTPIFQNISDGLTKAALFVYFALLLPSALLSMVRESDSKELLRRHTVIDKVPLIRTPFLSEDEVSDAFRMSELYTILHCYENSARKMIETTLLSAVGTNWWDVVASSSMKDKYQQRKQKANKDKWLSPRGDSALYYIDWGDLVTLIRKREKEFESVIPDLKFVVLRLEELEKLRNIVAHHGVLPSSDDFQRVVLSFRDWCHQIRS